MNSPAGQAAIRLREALRKGDLEVAHGEIEGLDLPHRAEILLGGALRHEADGFAAVGAWRAAQAHPVSPPAWRELCARLAAPATNAHDQRAAAWIASGLVPHSLANPGGAAPADMTTRLSGPEAESALVEALRGGAGAGSLLAVWPGHPLLPAVKEYVESAIGALGPRPLLYLAIVPAEAAHNA